MAQSPPAMVDLIRICAELNDDMGTTFQLRAAHISNVRDHILTIQTESVRGGPMDEVQERRIDAINNFDDIEPVPCECELCCSKGVHAEGTMSRDDNVHLGNVTDDDVIEKEGGRLPRVMRS